MGLLRDAIGSALGANQVSNGFNGPKLPFVDNGKPQKLSPSPQGPIQRHSAPDLRCESRYNNFQDPWDSRLQHETRRVPHETPPPPYWPEDRYRPAQTMHFAPRQYPSYQTSPARSPRGSLSSECRTVALPQIAYGDGQPFLRGYSDELGRFGILEDAFLGIVEAINVAVIPNPEVQIFQKAAGIAGWFIPGSASIGLMAGQVGVGIGAALGHKSMINRVLSKANLEVFLPKGLEICIGKSKDLDAELGISPYSTRQISRHAYCPEERLDSYNGLVAPLSVILPPLQTSGRNDPIAMLGRGLGARSNQRKIRKAQEDASEGKHRKGDSLEGDLKWLMIRKATPAALEHWRRKLEESDAELRQ